MVLLSYLVLKIYVLSYKKKTKVINLQMQPGTFIKKIDRPNIVC